MAPIAQEVTDVLKEKGYEVLVQDYDIPLTANFIEEMHEAVKNSRDLIVYDLVCHGHLMPVRRDAALPGSGSSKKWPHRKFQKGHFSGSVCQTVINSAWVGPRRQRGAAMLLAADTAPIRTYGGDRVQTARWSLLPRCRFTQA